MTVPSKLNRLLLEVDELNDPSDPGCSDSSFFTEGFFDDFFFKVVVEGDWVDRGCWLMWSLTVVIGFGFESLSKAEGKESGFFFVVLFSGATEDDLIERVVVGLDDDDDAAVITD